MSSFIRTFCLHKQLDRAGRKALHHLGQMPELRRLPIGAQVNNLTHYSGSRVKGPGRLKPAHLAPQIVER
jgi:hypothetical protein